jgi:hypothetical protein
MAWVVFAAALLGRAQLGRLGFDWTVALLPLAGWVWLSTIWAAPA